MGMKTELTFINRSYDVSRSDIVIFQPNEAARGIQCPIAWKVIKRCPVDWSHPFIFSSELHVGIRDRERNFSPRVPVNPGTLVCVSHRPSGSVALDLEKAEHPVGIYVENRLEAAGCDVEIYRDGRLLSHYQALKPRARAAFRFGHRIFVAAVSGINEGDPLRTSDLHWLTLTQLDLLGVTSTDIVMTGGGYGPDATPLRFHHYQVKTWPA